MEALLRREWKDNSGARPVIEPGDFPAMDESVWDECFPVMIQPGVWEAFLTIRLTSAVNLTYSHASVWFMRWL